MENSKEKIRRCREHVSILRDGENCSYLKHSKNNKIEEMTKQEAEILDWVEMNTTVGLKKNNQTGKEKLLFIPTKKHYKTKKFYYKVVDFNPQTQNLKEVIGDNFREMAQLIVKDIEGNVRGEDGGWVLEKVVYQFCPNAICGENPCICKNGK